MKAKTSIIWLVLLFTFRENRAELVKCTNDECTIKIDGIKLNLDKEQWAIPKLNEVVHTIRFAGPNLEVFPSQLLQCFPDVSTLIAKGMHIQKINALDNQKYFSNHTKLSNIIFSNNQLKSLENGIFSGSGACSCLNLANNLLEMLPDKAFEGLNSLTDIHLENNKLTRLPVKIFAPLTKLAHLKLANNKLTTLSTNAFQNNQQLYSINVESNQLLSIETPVKDIHTKSLKLANNCLSDISNLTNFRGLVNLHLSYNKQLPLNESTFDGLSGLRELYMIDVNLNRVDGNFSLFKALQELELLNIDNNGLNTLSLTHFPKLKKLVSLSLDYNGLVSLDYVNLKVNFPRITQISLLGGNNWNCTYLKEMKDYLKKTATISVLKRVYDRNNVCLADQETDFGFADLISNNLMTLLIVSVVMGIIVTFVITLLGRRKRRLLETKNHLEGMYNLLPGKTTTDESTIYDTHGDSNEYPDDEDKHQSMPTNDKTNLNDKHDGNIYKTLEDIGYANTTRIDENGIYTEMHSSESANDNTNLNNKHDGHLYETLNTPQIDENACYIEMHSSESTNDSTNLNDKHDGNLSGPMKANKFANTPQTDDKIIYGNHMWPKQEVSIKEANHTGNQATKNDSSRLGHASVVFVSNPVYGTVKCLAKPEIEEDLYMII